MILGQELRGLLCDCVACCCGQGQMQGFPLDAELTATISVRRWFPGLDETLQKQIVTEILEALEHERRNAN